LALPLAGLPACRAWPADAAVAAIVIHPTAASRAALERAVSQSFHGAPIRLADDALTRDSLLVVGRAQARDVRGLPLNGRELEHPQHFRLLRRGSQCVLLHLETGKARVLTHTACRPLPARNGLTPKDDILRRGSRLS
jgi:hypothetical protein